MQDSSAQQRPVAEPPQDRLCDGCSHVPHVGACEGFALPGRRCQCPERWPSAQQRSVERIRDYLANCANPDGCDEEGPARVCMCFQHPLYDDDLRDLLARLDAVEALCCVALRTDAPSPTSYDAGYDAALAEIRAALRDQA